MISCSRIDAAEQSLQQFYQRVLRSIDVALSLLVSPCRRIVSFFQKANSSARGGQGKGAVEKMKLASVSLRALSSDHKAVDFRLDSLDL